MANSFPEIKKFLGLFAQANSFVLPDGAMERAINLVINDDDVVSKVRGFYEYNDPSVGTLNQLYLFANRLFAIFNSKISYFTDTGSSPNETGTETTLSGQTVLLSNGRISRGLEQNGNFYFTTDNGVLKLDAYNATIFKAGAPPGLDLRGNFLSANGPIEAETQVGIRVLFGRRDANQNLVLGAPSDTLVLTNSKSTGVAWARSGAGPYDVVVTSPGHNLVAGMSVVISNGNATINGTQTVDSVTSTTFTFGSFVADPGASGTLDWTSTRSGLYEFSIPSEITSTTQAWFYQVYRSTQSGASATAPDADFRLINETLLSSAEITAGFVSFTDEVDDILVEFAPELYTNPNSREGELQANTQPPLCEDLALFNNFVFYGNCTSRHLLNLDVIDAGALASGDYIETAVLSGSSVSVTSVTNAAGDLQINSASHGLSNGTLINISTVTGGSLTAGSYYVVSAGASSFEISLTSGGASIAYSAVTALSYQSATVRRYVARTGVGNRTVESEGITNAGGDLRIDYASHGLTNGDSIYISTITGGSLTAGTYYVVSAAAGNFEISLTPGGASVAYSAVTSLYFEGVTNGTNPIFQLDTSSSTVSTQLRNTAQGIVRAINRDTSSLAYGNYVSGITDTPGKMRLTAKGFTGTIYVRANSSGAGGGFAPVLPAAFSSGTQVFSTNDTEQNAVYISKIGQPEAVPVVNKILVGSKNKAIKRVLSLRNSVIVLKEDGVFKITGDSPQNFLAVALDNTIQVVAANSATNMNNRVFFQATEGVCTATDTAVEIISRRIENRFEPIGGISTLNAQTAAVAYETDRTYRLSTILPNETTKTITYLYNVINDTWSESDELFSGGVVGPENALYLISTDNRILKERKKNTRIDYTNQNYAITVDSVEADMMSGRITSSTYTPLAGDIIVKSDVINRIESVSAVSATVFDLEFQRSSNLAAADSLFLYERQISEIKMAPFHAGIVGRTKQFSQLQVHTRTPSISRLYATFVGQTFGGSEETDWSAADISSSEGWGDPPFGYFPWGLADTIDTVYSTQPAPIVRLYVPLFQQRNTFIQAYLTHREGGEAMDIQALSWTVRAYMERVTR